MYFGEERDEALNGGKSPVLMVMLAGSAIIMVAGIINMFGVETAAATAAEMLLR